MDGVPPPYPALGSASALVQDAATPVRVRRTCRGILHLFLGANMVSFFATTAVVILYLTSDDVDGAGASVRATTPALQSVWTTLGVRIVDAANLLYSVRCARKRAVSRILSVAARLVTVAASVYVMQLRYVFGWSGNAENVMISYTNLMNDILTSAHLFFALLFLLFLLYSAVRKCRAPRNVPSVPPSLADEDDEHAPLLASVPTLPWSAASEPISIVSPPTATRSFASAGSASRKDEKSGRILSVLRYGARIATFDVLGGEDEACVICFEPLDAWPTSLVPAWDQGGSCCGPITTRLLCRHTFHSVCLEDWLARKQSNRQCPTCRAPALFVENETDALGENV